MKIIKALIILVCVFSMSTVNAQSQKENEKEEYGYGIFSMEEFSSLHIWVDNQVEGLMLSAETLIEYETLFAFHLDKIGRYKDKENRDKVLPEAEYLKSIKENIGNLNSSVEPILSKDQNKKHLKLMAEFEKILTNKLLLNKKK
ncbi:hypothetical protein [uncultured Psychroserpens sp.]|uniref:hypothetical protein n=1 Tax=uncultured Psychroserpens sp. TaxID=255436 RepID=UPI00261F68FF|nr:hypothetical protein [uncultured Psychroserpens sp.]